MTEKVLYNVVDHVGQIVLNNPKNFNSMDDELFDLVIEYLNKAEVDNDVHVVTITGSGPAFCGGGDINMMHQQYTENPEHSLYVLAKKAGAMVHLIKKLKKIVIVGVHNVAAGGGNNLAIAGDFLIAEENTRFLQAFVKLGLVPDTGGLYLLGRAIGANKAVQYGLTGEPVSAEQGVTDGFVYKTVAKGTIQEETQEFAQQFVNGPRKAFELIKEENFVANYHDMEAYLEKEATYIGDLSQTKDFKEGIAAFVEKRAPKFTGE